jgi:hypothetical protein
MNCAVDSEALHPRRIQPFKLKRAQHIRGKYLVRRTIRREAYCAHLGINGLQFLMVTLPCSIFPLEYSLK